MKKLISILMALVLALGVSAAFAEKTGLPAYTFEGDDPIQTAVLNALATYDFGYTVPEGGVVVPAPIILKTEVNQDETEATVYGNFWVFTYELKDKTLVCTSGGEAAGVMKLAKKDGQWVMTSLEVAEAGDNYQENVLAFANGDKELEEAYLAAGDVSEGPLEQYRRSYLILYVLANNLDIEAYQDYGWDPVSLTD